MINPISMKSGRGLPQSKTLRVPGCERSISRWLTLFLLTVALTLAAGCGTRKIGKKSDDFFTSGSREADQRASQRMARDEQLTGSGEGPGEKGVNKAVTIKPTPGGAPYT